MTVGAERPVVVAVVGPTASGKTGLAVDLARELGAEVVNADSMQLYEGMDVGTAKATGTEQRGVPHHLFDIWPPTREASVSDYQLRAREAVDTLLRAGTSAVLVGGSGLYVRAVLDDLEFPATDPGVRARLEAELDRVGSGALYTRLKELDPAAAAANHPANGRRIVRALEVIELTGRPFSATLPTYGTERWGTLQLGIDPPLPELDERIRRRVDRMWAEGLVEETRRLAADPGLGPTARRALGYAQVLAWDRGELGSEAEVREATVVATRRYSRRQRSWFLRDRRIRWLVGGPPDAPVGDAGPNGRADLLRLAQKLLQQREIHPFGVGENSSRTIP